MSLNLLNPFRFGVVPPPVVGEGVWTEVGRTTLGVAGDSILVTGLPNKRYYQVLTSLLPTGGNTTGRIRLGNTTIDSGTNYAQRISINGGADGTNATQPRWQGSAFSTPTPHFQNYYISNLSANEKLGIGHAMIQNTAGAANPPQRSEWAQKWTNAVNPIERIETLNDQAGSYDIGSEMVVLGWTPTDTHATSANFWEDLTDASFVSGTTITTPTFPVRRYLWIQGWTTNTLVANTRLKFGNATIDNSANYASRDSRNGGADSTVASINEILIGRGSPTSNLDFYNIFVINRSTSEKLVIAHTQRSFGSGGGTAPQRQETVGKWVNTVNPIDIVRFDTEVNDYTDGQIRVWGHN